MTPPSMDPSASSPADTQQASAQPAPKSKNQEKNEAKRLEKLAKYQAKLAKQAAAKQSEAGSSANSAAASSKKKDSSASKTAAPAAAEEEFVNTTPKGDKKDLSAPFPPSYRPKAVEAAWYDWWEKEGFFKPELKPDGSALDNGTFVVPIPPPNVTGSLHLGHALTNSIQDAMIRWNRMRGKTTLWVPGADHAGIATQIVVEKKLMRERKLNRHDLGREAFIQEVFKWKDVHIDRIYNQLRRLGSSYDWEHARFTMDEDLCNAVNEAFVRMHDDGTIYRANRLVNWCTKLKTALSNLEVDNKELKGSTFLSVPDHDPSKKYEFGVLISFAYQVENSDERIVVATTRLETMLGDTAIAVHPSDKRYLHLHGKYVIHPFQNRRIPIVPDEYPDPEFGTGAVKITPAHDFNDFVVGQRNNLEFINIFTDDGKINENGAPFTGLQRFDARVAVLEALKEKGLYVDKKDNEMQLPICERSGNVIEPLLKPQWWINCKDMAKQAIDAVKTGELTIVPATSEKDWFRWLENIQDWCISRQLWWGHRVPAYFVVIEGDANNRDDANRWVSARSEEEARSRALSKFSDVDPSKISLQQDDDVLDTWFSSGLWPFSVMGWPKETPDMKLYFPNTLLETGWDILFFWVARMVMMSLKLTGSVPFRQVFCHAMVRDAHGRKMSKSLGNVIDPLDVIEGITLDLLQKRLENGNLDPSELERAKAGQRMDYPSGIPECGTDALRFALLAYTSAGRDINLDILRVEGYRKFCNKIWNATRFALMKLGDDYRPDASADFGDKKPNLVDKWILGRLNVAIRETNTHLAQMNFMQATNAVYQFWLYELCDVYLEVCKPVIDGADEQARETARAVLYTCLDCGLKLLHPFMPFVTEELYQRLPRRSGDAVPSIMKAAYPSEVAEWDDAHVESSFEYLNAVAKGARSLMMEYNIRSNATLFVEADGPDQRRLVESENATLLALIKGARTISVLERGAEKPAGCVVQTGGAVVHLLVRGQLDLESEIAKLQARLGKAQSAADSLKRVMDGDGYAERVREEVKQTNANKYQNLQEEIETLSESIRMFSILSQE